ncbi:MAG TPA: MarR family transcriptional regulator [Ensifer sp.]|nr:MarR family transcriptional regulator [Ensifer sp.]
MDKVDEMPGHHIRRLNQIAVAVFHVEVGGAGSDLTPVQFAALATLKDNPGIDQATLAGLIAYDRTTIMGVVDRLVQKGLVNRAVNGKDRRARLLEVTAEGLALLEAIHPAVLSAQRLMLSGLTDAEADTFLILLKKATRGANDLSRAPMKSVPES